MTAHQPLSFQQIILKLHEFWAAQGCVLWQPYNIQVGAGTGNPATLLRVLGPEPWRVAYVEPSVRPDDGRYGENPNRMQYYYQYQVILKPDPGNPQELYMRSLKALGINPREHDIRFVEDNWESPALGAWGLGWEVWLDGQEITQFTYFQQAGGIELDPVSVEITYGLERIAIPLQNKNRAWDIAWLHGLSEQDALHYGDIFLQSEIEHCKYYFEVADVVGLKQTYDTYENESKRALDAGLVIPSYDYVLKCSHLFNVLDARGAIGVTERASYFRRMRDMTRKVARAYHDQRRDMEYPLDKLNAFWAAKDNGLAAHTAHVPAVTTNEPEDVLIEIGVEELPPDDLDTAVAQLNTAAPKLFADLRLTHQGLEIYGTPRRLVVIARKVISRQPDLERIDKGPAADRAFDAQGKPTKAAEGFARSRGLTVDQLRVEETDGGKYVMATVHVPGRSAAEVLAEKLPEFVGGIKFVKSMRWNNSGVAFSRPIRWLTALFDHHVIPFSYAGVNSSNFTRGLRPYASPQHDIVSADGYLNVLRSQGIQLDPAERRRLIQEGVTALAKSVGGRVPEDVSLLDEVTNLVEAPTAFIGTFEEKYLRLPREVLVTVMKKKQRYFAVEDANGNLLPYFIGVRNGDAEHLDKVTHGNEQVLRARFADAEYFFSQDTARRIDDFLPRLSTLTFQEKLGSMLDKNQRIAHLVDPLGKLLGYTPKEIAAAASAASILKADLATQMVVEMTSLQGAMGREYALLAGYSHEVADAIYEHWLPRGAGDKLPQSRAGILLAIADRLDSLVGLFAVGLAPQATADPYGLRRSALGIIEIVTSRGIDINLREAAALTRQLLPVDVSDETLNQVMDFIAGRLKSWLDDAGYPFDVSAAVLAEQAANPARAVANIKELQGWVSRADWSPILDGFARCVRITRDDAEHYTINPAAFAQQEERDLYAAYQAAAAKLSPEGGVDDFLNAFVPMLPAITAFFGTGKGDGVLVNAPEPELRANRHALLQAIAAMQRGRADLSHLSGF